MLRAIATNLWVAEQPLKYFGLEVGTRMTVIRLSQDQLVLITPIKLQGDITDQLNQLGNVSDIIAPNLYHHLFLNQCKPDVAQTQHFGQHPVCKINVLIC